MAKRRVEVFTAGCSVCEEAVKTVRNLVCESCNLEVLDMRTESAKTKARKYGIKRVPAVVVNGRLADCGRLGGIDSETLERLGVGRK